MIKTDRNDLDIVIAQYTLGLLTPKENAEVRELLNTSPEAARYALRWEEDFLTLVDVLPQARPPEAILDAILATLDLPPAKEAADAWVPDAKVPSQVPVSDTVFESERKPEPEPKPDPGFKSEPKIDSRPAPERPRPADPEVHHPHDTKVRRLSKTARISGVILALIMVGLLGLAFIPRTPAEPPIVVVEVAPTKGAILQAPGQSSTPGWVVTIDQENNVTLAPKVHTETPPDSAVQLWTYNKTVPQPRSLGLIDPNQPVAVPATLMGEIGEDQFFEMTLEPAGGSPTTEPTGPILFIGRVVTFSQ